MNYKSNRIIFASLVLTFFAYSYMVYTSGTENDNGVSFSNEQSKRGKLIFQNYNCVACHQIYGMGGYMGPDITNVISANNKGPEYVRTFLQSGSRRMPDFHLNENELNDLIAYLSYIDKTGISPVKNFKINYDGTVDQK